MECDVLPAAWSLLQLTKMKRNSMKIITSTILGGIGLGYGITAGVLVYHDVPISLQSFIALGVASVGVLVGWLLGVGFEFFLRTRRLGRKHLA